MICVGISESYTFLTIGLKLTVKRFNFKSFIYFLDLNKNLYFIRFISYLSHVLCTCSKSTIEKKLSKIDRTKEEDL